MRLVMAVESAIRGPRLALVAVAVALALLAALWGLGAFPWQVGASRGTLPPMAQTVVEQYAREFAAPHGFAGYWMQRTLELDPLRDADVVVAGRVESVTAIRMLENKTNGRINVELPTHVDFSVVCAIKGVNPSTKRIALGYVTPGSGYLGGIGAKPNTLGPNASYLLLLKRPGWGRRDFAYDPEGGPLPIPLATIDPDACHGDTPQEIMAALLIASWRVTDSELRGYAAPVLGYLAHFHDQAEARAELIRAIRSKDVGDVQTGFRWLTTWGKADTEVLAVAAERSSDDDPVISAEALAVRIKADGTTALLGEVVAWSKHPDVSDQVPLSLLMALDHMHPGAVTEELLRQYEDLLTPDTPLGVRYRAVRQLGEIGTMEVAPLLVRALDDPSGRLRLDAIEALYKASRCPGAPDLEDHVPVPIEFDADPDRYTSFWKQWWEKASNDGWPPTPEQQFMMGGQPPMTLPLPQSE